MLVARADPPVLAEYHRTVVPFAPAVPVKTIVPGLHLVLSDAIGMAGIGLTVATTAVRVALSQPVVEL